MKDKSVILVNLTTAEQILGVAPGTLSSQTMKIRIFSARVRDRGPAFIDEAGIIKAAHVLINEEKEKGPTAVGLRSPILPLPDEVRAKLVKSSDFQDIAERAKAFGFNLLTSPFIKPRNGR